MKIKVLIGPSTFAANDRRPLERLHSAGYDVVPNPLGRKLVKDELLGLLQGVTAIVAGLESLTADVLRGSGLKVISRCGAGTDNVDLEVARELGIKVFSTPDAPTASVAELAVGAMISMLRSIPQMDRDMHGKLWNKSIGTQLAGKTVCIIGYGKIGRYVANLLKNFNVRLIAVDPAADPDDEAKTGIEIMALSEALPQADIVTIHTSGGKELIGGREVAAMKKGAYICNSSRGSVVNEDAVADAMYDGRIAGVWFDVFSEEPYKGRLSESIKAVLTPHVGSYTAECRSRMEMEAVENLIGGLSDNER